ncbi:ATP-binding protein [Aneurinibacillus sp. UBA3580]|jgi:hypothetical protein|uniref:ATP-binding protein n=1 Tax=Aneurinibacillus sp. UBA3580 TaxID=1946041 RepID=UPI00257A7B7C|nr:ATP-binding protein [Aneurinibacillus sp. UBA3580]
MIGSLEVQVTDDHLKKLLNITPIKALSELIWNSLDADATKVEVTLEKNELEGIRNITISDNGHGIDFRNVERQFGNLGDSHKIKDEKSPLGRRYHGKLGQGRYSGFVLAREVEWISTYSDQRDIFQEFSIMGNEDQLKKFEVLNHRPSVSTDSGVTVYLTNLRNEQVDILANDGKVIKELSFIFAPYLLAYPGIIITLNGVTIDPKNQMKQIKDYFISVENEDGEKVEGNLKVVEWKSGKYKNLYLCNRDGVAYEEEIVKGWFTGFSHTGYLMSDVVEQLLTQNNIAVRDLNPDYVLLREEVYRILKEIYREKQALEAIDEVKRMKEENIYPYSGQPESVIEKAERQVFDICAVKVNELLPEFRKASKESRQFTYRLLKESLQANPNNLKLILKEVLNLSINQQDELAKILEKTSLDAMINTTKIISDRLAFLNGLEQILYGKDFEKRLKERSQLHKILLGELWLFGEHYSYGYDDIALKTVLKEHLKVLEREELAEEIDFKNLQGLNDIPDIGLYKQIPMGPHDCFENLVIELKRPSCVLGSKELTQIEEYAFAIAESKYFDKEKTKWTLYLLGTKMDNHARRKASQQDRSPGLIYSGNNIQVWVKEWNQIIQEAKGRHRFLQERLELEVRDNSEGMDYLRKKYSEYLPD